MTSLNTPINWRQENMPASTGRLTNKHPPDAALHAGQLEEQLAQRPVETLWGDDPFPAVDSNWDQPGQSLIAQLTHNIGSNGVNTLTFSYSANVITVTRGGTDPGAERPDQRRHPGDLPRQHQGVRRRSRPPDLLRTARGYGDDLRNKAPFKNNQDLFVLKDDYSAVFGKHFFKAGVVGSYNKKNEDVFDQGSAESSQFGDAVGLDRRTATRPGTSSPTSCSRT